MGRNRGDFMSRHLGGDEMFLWYLLEYVILHKKGVFFW